MEVGGEGNGMEVGGEGNSMEVGGEGDKMEVGRGGYKRSEHDEAVVSKEDKENTGTGRRLVWVGGRGEGRYRRDKFLMDVWAGLFDFYCVCIYCMYMY